MDLAQCSLANDPVARKDVCKADSQVGLQAYAAARMAESVLRGMAGEGDIYECCYVQSQVTEVCPTTDTSAAALARCKACVERATLFHVQ